MAVPTFLEAQIYKSPTICSQIRVAVGLDYPVFSGAFHDDFNGAGLPDAAKWFSTNPSWGKLQQVAGALEVGTTVPGIAPSWCQSRHNLAFPLKRYTDWVFEIRCAANPITGYGAFVRICGRSFRDAEAIWALKANTADGLEVHGPDGFFSDTVLWSNGADSTVNRYRVTYDASAQTYTVEIDADDDGTFEIGPFVYAVAGRYADAIVIGNSTAVQGALGAWTEWHVDYVDVVGVAEAVADPDWAAPFTFETEHYTYLPANLGGQVNLDVDNVVDAGEVRLANFGLDEEMNEARQLYTDVRFLNRPIFVEARAGDGQGNWTAWQLMFRGKCAEKRVDVGEGGNCTLSVPFRDRYRATADDMEINGCYSDAGAAIDGVVMNKIVSQIMADIYDNKCGLPAAAHNIVATPNNKPRNYNVFRKSGQQSVKELADMTALCLYQLKATGVIQVQEWFWGTDVTLYTMNTGQEIRSLNWTESAFDVTSAEQLSLENTEYPAGGFTATWPPHRQPFYGRQVHSNAVTCQVAADLYARPINCLVCWVRNRKLGSVTVKAKAQLWWSIGDEVRIRDARFLGLDDIYILDGYTHSWDGDNVIESEGRFIFPHPDRFLRENLAP